MTVRLRPVAPVVCVVVLTLGACGDGGDPPAGAAAVATTAPPPTTVVSVADTPAASTDKSQISDEPEGSAATAPERSPATTSAPPATVVTDTLPITPPSTPSTIATSQAGAPAVSEAEVAELEQALDEIDQLLADLEADLAAD